MQVVCNKYYHTVLQVIRNMYSVFLSKNFRKKNQQIHASKWTCRQSQNYIKNFYKTKTIIIRVIRPNLKQKKDTKNRLWNFFTLQSRLFFPTGTAFWFRFNHHLSSFLYPSPQTQLNLLLYVKSSFLLVTPQQNVLQNHLTPINLYNKSYRKTSDGSTFTLIFHHFFYKPISKADKLETYKSPAVNKGIKIK